MTQHPYTDTDLRTEAAHQHAALTEDPDFMCVGEQMEGRYVQSTVIDEDPDFQPEGNTWDTLAPHDFEAAQRDVHSLINRAADVSEWAVNLGADSLQPDALQLTWSAGEQPIVRVHFAFHAGMSDEARDYLVTAVGEALQAQMDSATEAAR